MFLLRYLDADADSGTLSAWGGYCFVIAEMLLLFLVGVGLALGVLDGRSLRGPAVTVVIGFAFLVTITAVIALFVARPDGKARPWRSPSADLWDWRRTARSRAALS